MGLSGTLALAIKFTSLRVPIVRGQPCTGNAFGVNLENKSGAGDSLAVCSTKCRTLRTGDAADLNLLRHLPSFWMGGGGTAEWATLFQPKGTFSKLDISLNSIQ